MNKKVIKTGFCSISGRAGSSGHVSRALALFHALQRLGVDPTGKTPVKVDGDTEIYLEFWLVGAVDSPALWEAENPELLDVVEDGVPYVPRINARNWSEWVQLWRNFFRELITGEQVNVDSPDFPEEDNPLLGDTIAEDMTDTQDTGVVRINTYKPGMYQIQPGSNHYNRTGMGSGGNQFSSFNWTANRTGENPRTPNETYVKIPNPSEALIRALIAGENKALLDEYGFTRELTFREKQALVNLLQGMPKSPNEVDQIRDAKRLEVSTRVATHKFDLLLVDSSAHWLDPLLKFDSYLRRPPNVWGIGRYYDRAYAGVSPGSLDRLYQAENFQAQYWNPNMTRQLTRSQAQKEAIAKGYAGDIEQYKELYLPDYDHVGYEQGQDWREYQQRNIRADRKLIDPVIDVDPSLILNRNEARKGLLLHAGYPLEVVENDLLPSVLNGDRKLVLITGRREHASSKRDKDDYGMWVDEQLNDIRATIKSHFPDKTFTRDVIIPIWAGMGANPLPKLYTYLAGVDYLLTLTGYNMFYEIRYLTRLGLFDGRDKQRCRFFPLRDRVTDQSWRYSQRDRLMSDECHPIAEKGAGGTPEKVGNGADYIARAMLIKLGLLDV